VSIMTFRSFGLWAQGYPDAAIADADQALKHAREIDHAASLMFALSIPALTFTFSGNYATVSAHAEEAIALANDKGTAAWKAFGLMNQGWLMVLTGRAADAINTLICGIDEWRSTGSTIFVPLYQSYLARAHAEVGQFDGAWRCISDAVTLIETTNQRFWESDTHIIGGEIALKSPDLDYAKAEASFEHALAVARQQQAKSWELRAAMSLARPGATKANRSKLANCLRRFTAGSRKGSLRAI
jgi:predicted ATPase